MLGPRVLLAVHLLISNRGRPKKTWKMQVEKESKSVGLEKEDALNRARCRELGVGEIAVRVG